MARSMPSIPPSEALALRRVIAASGTRAAPFFSPVAVARWLSQGRPAATIAQASEVEQFRFLGWYCFQQPKHDLRWSEIQDIEDTVAALAGAALAPTSVPILPLTALMLVTAIVAEDQPVKLEGTRTCDALLSWYADDLLRWFCLQGVTEFGLIRLLTREQVMTLRQPAKTPVEGAKACIAATWLRTMRPDVRDAFPLDEPENGRQLDEWFLQYGLWEHGLTHLLLPDELDRIRAELATPEPAGLPAFLMADMAKIDSGDASLARRATLLPSRNPMWSLLLGPRCAAAAVFPERSDPPSAERPTTRGSQMDTRLAVSRYRVTAGRRAYFVDGAGATALLVTGSWNRPEPSHTWTKRHFATIGFTLDSSAPDAPLSQTHMGLELELHYDETSVQRFGTTLTLTLDGAVVTQMPLPSVQQTGGYFTVRTILPYRPGVRVLGVGLDRLFSPSEFGSHDTRTLGIAVRSMLVRWC